MTKRVIMHPCDKERAESIARIHKASVTLSENWPADSIGLDGFGDGPSGWVMSAYPGWYVKRLVGVAA